MAHESQAIRNPSGSVKPDDFELVASESFSSPCAEEWWRQLRQEGPVKLSDDEQRQCKWN